jgi:ferrous iron transport protein B
MYLRGKVFVTTAGTIIVYMSVIIWALSYFPRSDAAVRQYKAQYAVGHPRADVSEVDQFVKEKQLENSVLGTFGRTIEPVFRPAGFDWRITTSILSAFPARETVVPSLGIIFSLGEGDEKDAQYKVSLRKALSDAKWPNGKRLMNAWTAVGLMVFFALCAQCMATLATVKRETNSWKWPVFMFCYMTLLGYLGAVAVYQVGHLLGKV